MGRVKGIIMIWWGVIAGLMLSRPLFLMIKLKHLDEYIEARRKAADFYDKAFAGHAKNQNSFQGILLQTCVSSIYFNT